MKRLRKQDRDRLERLAQKPDVRQKISLRAQIILGADEGKSISELARVLHVSRPTVSLWCKRYAEKGISGLHDAVRPGRPGKLDTPAGMAILNAIRAHLKEMDSQGADSSWIPSRVAHSCQTDVGMVKRIWRAYRLRYPSSFLKKRRRAISEAYFQAERKAGIRFPKRFEFQVIRGAFKGQDCCNLEQPTEHPEYFRVKFRSTSKALPRQTFLIRTNAIALKGR